MCRCGSRFTICLWAWRRTWCVYVRVCVFLKYTHIHIASSALYANSHMVVASIVSNPVHDERRAPLRMPSLIAVNWVGRPNTHSSHAERRVCVCFCFCHAWFINGEHSSSKPHANVWRACTTFTDILAHVVKSRHNDMMTMSQHLPFRFRMRYAVACMQMN